MCGAISLFRSPLLLTSVLWKYLSCAVLSTLPIKILLSITPSDRYYYPYVIKGKQRYIQRVSVICLTNDRAQMWGPRFIWLFRVCVRAFGSKSKLRRHLNVTPYSLEYLEISHWLAFQLGFLELVGSLQAFSFELPPGYSLQL